MFAMPLSFQVWTYRSVREGKGDNKSTTKKNDQSKMMISYKYVGEGEVKWRERCKHCLAKPTPAIYPTPKRKKSLAQAIAEASFQSLAPSRTHYIAQFNLRSARQTPI